MVTRFAMIGSGKMGHTIAKDFAQCEDVRLTTLVSRSPRGARSTADDWGVADVITMDELPHADVDAVYISTPNHSHLDLALRSLRSGKHVLVEKAFAMSGRESRELVTVAHNHGLFLMEAMWMRFNPAIRRAHELIQSGAIGEPRTLNASSGRPVHRATAVAYGIQQRGAVHSLTAGCMRSH